METTKKNYIYTFIFVLFVILLFIVGFHHEPWADEAQCWLIARDSSLSEILFHDVKYEGHPFLWFFIEKLFINTHITNSVDLYNWVFILPLICSSIGVYVFLFKSKFPMIIKCLVPFTFYIFYQYGVISRNHSLCFPFLMIIAAFYHKRFEHPYIYALLLFLTANVSAYTLIIAGVLFVFFIVDIIREKLEIKKYIPSILIIALSFLFTALILIPPSDNYVKVVSEFIDTPLRIYHPAAVYFSTGIRNIFTIVLFSILTFIFYLSVIKVYCKNLYQVILFVSLNLPIFLFFLLIYGRFWHYGYAGIILLFTCWILTEMNDIKEIPFKKNWIFYIFLVYIFGYYVIGNIKVSYFDIKNSYDGSKAAAEFIKKYNLQEYEMMGSEFKTVSMLPYFDKKIYSNFNGQTHFFWQDDFCINLEEELKKGAPIIIFLCHNFKTFPEKKLDGYYEFLFNGYMNSINYTNEDDEGNEYNVYIKKELVEKIPGLAEDDSFFIEENDE